MIWRSLIFSTVVLLIMFSGAYGFQHNEAGAVNEQVAAPHGAADGQHATTADGHGTEKISIFDGNLITAILTLAIFLVLLMILGKWAWGPILTGLQKREEHIRQSIEDAEKARVDAEDMLKKHKEQLDLAKQESSKIIEKGRDEAIRLSEELKVKAGEDVMEMRKQAERDITIAKNNALKQICDQSVDLAADIAGKIILRELESSDHKELLQESLSKLQIDYESN